MAGAMIDLHPIPLSTWFFIIFFIALRIKMFLDDIRYFWNADAKRQQFKLGFVCGVASWFFWVISALHLGERSRFCGFLAAAIAIGTIPMIITGTIRRGFFRRPSIWITANGVYLSLLLVIVAIGQSLSENIVTILLLCCICMTVVDCMLSESLKALEEM